MRSAGAAIAFVLACSLALGLGCATVEPIHRPPTPAEINRVNGEGPLVVEPLSTDGPSPTIDHVVSADAAKIVVAPEEDFPCPSCAARDPGAPYPLRLDDVSAFVAHRPGLGAAIGAGVGAGLSTVFILSLLAPLHGDPGPREPPDSGYDARIGRFILEAALVSGAVGALIGAVAGSRHYFPLNPGPASPLGPAPPPPPSPPTPAVKRSASVAAPSAEVRSAPFKVAPVVLVLAKGQRLFVDATPHAGWLVAFLSDGRVGYIQDTQVKVDSP